MRIPRHLVPYGPSALLINWEARIDPAINQSVHGYAAKLRNHPAVIECVPAYASLLVRFRPTLTSAYRLREFIFDLPPQEENETQGFHHDLPVCYHPSLAPDLKAVIATLKTTAKTLITRHTSPNYLVYQLGFKPGFGFLGETDERLRIDRHSAPRPLVPAGSVGLAGRQTGIYPEAGPGGWQLIGNCPVPLLQEGEDVARFRAGDTVSFHAVSLTEFNNFNPSSLPWPVR